MHACPISLSLSLSHLSATCMSRETINKIYINGARHTILIRESYFILQIKYANRHYGK